MPQQQRYSQSSPPVVVFSAAVVGLLSGLLGALFWFLVQFFSDPEYQSLYKKAYLIPVFLGSFSALCHYIVRKSYSRKNSLERRQSITDILESFYFGTFIGEYLRWFSRAVTSLGSFLGLGLLGIEGAVLEFDYFALPAISRWMNLFIEEKQALVIYSFSGALSIAFGAPFSGTIMALEMIQVAEGRLRASAVVSALVSQGVVLLFLRGVELDRFQFFPSLFLSIQSADHDLQTWSKIAVATIILGFLVGTYSFLNNRILSRSNEVFGQTFGLSTSLRVLFTGVLLSICIFFSQDLFSIIYESGRLGSDLSWLHLSGNQAALALVFYFSLMVIAFGGWGSAGLFTPLLIQGGFIGYLFGNMVTSHLSVPVTVTMSILGAATLLGASFGVPVAASCLVFEIGRSGDLWWLSVLCIASATFLLRAVKEEAFHIKLLERAGLRVEDGKISNILSRIKNREAMFVDFSILHEDAGFEEFKREVHASEHHFLAVVSKAGNFIGLIALEKLPRKVRSCLSKTASEAEVAALERVYDLKNLMDPYFPRVLPEGALHESLSLLKYSPCLAVVDDSGKILGLLYETSIILKYKNEIKGIAVRKF